ncbi:MAG: PEP-CTERM sorting domain-containing protein [Planctomycetota bacterium]|nr:PEP-CTERM sorting domain-containing protein [Planctomycetota bacterium]
MLSATASGDILWFNISADGWAPFLDQVADYGYAEQSATDFGSLSDFGITGIDGPVDENTSNAIFNPGDIPFDLAFDSNLNPFGQGGPAGRGPGGNGLVGVGPSGGFGNPSNALAANYFVDSFDIFATNEGGFRAIAFNALSLLGTDSVDLTAYDENEDALGSFGGSAPAGGNWYGAVMTPDQPSIFRMNLYDTGEGAEGVMDVITYVPAPGAIALFGLAGLAGSRRRRS